MKAIFKSIFLLLVFFVMLYVGMNNTDKIDFSFPIASREKIHAAAALIYFGVFAVGVHSGGGGKKSSGSKEK
jgi:uncharacterized membrane protein YciS (DUF1049 family)